MTALRIFLLDLYIDILTDQRRRISARLARAHDKRTRIPLRGLWDATK